MRALAEPHVRDAGEEHEPNESESSAHSNEASASFDENVNIAVRARGRVVRPVWIVVSGARSTVQEWVAGLASMLPAASVARTDSVWSPAVRSW